VCVTFVASSWRPPPEGWSYVRRAINIVGTEIDKMIRDR